MRSILVADNLGNFLRQAVLPQLVRHWTLTTLREKLIKIGAKVARHSGKIVFQMAEPQLDTNELPPQATGRKRCAAYLLGLGEVAELPERDRVNQADVPADQRLNSRLRIPGGVFQHECHFIRIGHSFSEISLRRVPRRSFQPTCGWGQVQGHPGFPAPPR